MSNIRESVNWAVTSQALRVTILGTLAILIVGIGAWDVMNEYMKTQRMAMLVQQGRDLMEYECSQIVRNSSVLPNSVLCATWVARKSVEVTP